MFIVHNYNQTNTISLILRFNLAYVFIKKLYT